MNLSEIVFVFVSVLVCHCFGSSTASSSLDYPLVNLSDANVMPQMGVGLGGRVKESSEQSLRTAQWALELGVRMIDTAAAYQNEEQVHEAIHASGIPRNEVFVCTKLDEEEHGFREAYEALDEALEETLQMDYVDLFLIHSPDEGKVVETWDALIALREDGKAKSIGVSNFGIPHLEAIAHAGRPMPVVNQMEMHPLIYAQRKELLEYCAQHDIRIMAFGSLFSGFAEFYHHPTLQNIAERAHKTVPQILLRWALDHGFIVIPTSSSSREHLQENYDILDFQLTPKELQQLDELGDPRNVGEDSEFSFAQFDAKSRYWNIDNDEDDEEEVDIGDLDMARKVRQQWADEEEEEELNDDEL